MTPRPKGLTQQQQQQQQQQKQHIANEARKKHIVCFSPLTDGVMLQF